MRWADRWRRLKAQRFSEILEHLCAARIFRRLAMFLTRSEYDRCVSVAIDNSGDRDDRGVLVHLRAELARVQVAQRRNCLWRGPPTRCPATRIKLTLKDF